MFVKIVCMIVAIFMTIFARVLNDGVHGKWVFCSKKIITKLIGWIWRWNWTTLQVLPSRDGGAWSMKKHYHDSKDGFNIALGCGYDLTKIEEMERHIYVSQNMQESTLVLQVLQTISPNNIFVDLILSQKKVAIFL